MFPLAVCLFWISSTFAYQKILHVTPGCPKTNKGVPHPQVRADVPAQVTASCRNGDKLFSSTNGVKFVISATLSQSYVGGNCQYYKKKGANIYTLQVSIAWGDHGSVVYTKKEIHTLTCAYDRNGNATSSREMIGSPLLNPVEIPYMKGKERKSANFSLKVMDVLDRELYSEHLHIGRLVRLRAEETSGTVTAFRALSCIAANRDSMYPILRAGCGDGLVFEKGEGFKTRGRYVFSPYFDAFKLQGSEKLRFECNFTICDGSCDGNSCPVESKRTKRSQTEEQDNGDYMHAVSLVMTTSHEEVQPETTDLDPKLPEVEEIDPNPFTSASHTQPVPGQGPPEQYCSKSTSAQADMALITTVLAIFGSLLLISFAISTYLCCKYELKQINIFARK